MGLFFLSTLIFTIFSGLYFTLDKERISPSEDRQTAMAGLFDSCRHAGVAQATAQPGFGLAPIDVPCSAGSLTQGGIPNLNVPGITIRAMPANLVIPGASGRLVITYIPLNTTVMNGIPFNEAVRQIRSVYGSESSTGLVADTTEGHRINNGNGSTGAFIPADISTGSFANARLIN